MKKIRKRPLRKTSGELWQNYVNTKTSSCVKIEIRKRGSRKMIVRRDEEREEEVRKG